MTFRRTEGGGVPAGCCGPRPCPASSSGPAASPRRPSRSGSPRAREPQAEGAQEPSREDLRRKGRHEGRTEAVRQQGHPRGAPHRDLHPQRHRKPARMAERGGFGNPQLGPAEMCARGFCSGFFFFWRAAICFGELAFPFHLAWQDFNTSAFHLNKNSESGDRF